MKRALSTSELLTSEKAENEVKKAKKKPVFDENAPKIKRALSTSELLSKKYKTFAFKDEWYEFVGQPETSGVWFIWANSGNGKTNFTLQLCKYLSQFGKVVYNSLEEGTRKTLQDSIRRVGMDEVKRKVEWVCESVADISERLSKQKSAPFVVIDSVQHAQMSYKQYLELKATFKNKLIILISQADGKQPSGRAARSIMYDADLKIWVEGYKAFTKGRYIGPSGEYTIWEEGAERYW